VPALQRLGTLEPSGDGMFTGRNGACLNMPLWAWVLPGYQDSRAETCSWREGVEVLVITPAEAEGAEVADE
jgi:hypothetical protein